MSAFECSTIYWFYSGFSGFFRGFSKPLKTIKNDCFWKFRGKTMPHMSVNMFIRFGVVDNLWWTTLSFCLYRYIKKKNLIFKVNGCFVFCFLFRMNFSANTLQCGAIILITVHHKLIIFFLNEGAFNSTWADGVTFFN